MLEESFNLLRAVYGHPIALIFGTIKVEDKIIWASQVKEVKNTKTEKKYFKDYLGTRAIYHTN